MNVMRRTLRTALTSLMVASTIVGCAGSTDSSPSPTDATGSAVPEALRFSAPLIGGGTLDGASLAGRDVVLWFWAPT